MSNRFVRKRAIKIALISVIILLIVIGGGWALLRSYIRPPEIPVAETNPTQTATPSPADDATPDIPEQGAEMPHLNPTENWERKPDFFTFLIFGLDDTLNADSIMIAAYDAVAQRAYILSIPRDTRVDVERPVGLRKIVVAYPTGLEQGGHEYGVEQLKQEVQMLIGFRPDFYISVEDMAFISLVDAVGGVEIYVPFHMQYDDPYQDLHIDIPAGLQVLDGENALHFVSYRLGNDHRYSITDHQRIRHQHQLLSTLFQDLLRPQSLLQIPTLVRTYYNHVGSNLSLGNKLWFGEQFLRIGDVDAITIYTIPIAGSSGAPGWYELPYVPGLLELINRTINPFTQDITADMLRIAA